MDKLLVQGDQIMVVSPLLAQEVGLNEAIVLQQVHYWLLKSNHSIGGRKWVYNSYQDWQRQFGFWSFSMIKRLFRSLEKQGYLLSDRFNKTEMDRTKWYSIDYDKLEQLGLFEESEISSTEIHDESLNEDIETEQGDNLNKAIPENTTENNSKITTKKNDILFPFSKIIEYLNEKNGSNFKATNKKTRAFIRERCREGYTLDDFKLVIDLKVAEWKHDPQMSKYLRPETLFGTKFESYLNQKTVRQTLREEDFDLED